MLLKLWRKYNQKTPALKKRRKKKWSIGLFTGDPLGKLEPHSENPILTAADVTDCKASFVADPFIIKADNYFIFLEVLNIDSGRGEIGVAGSEEGKHWEYQQLVLQEDCHLSYPLVFREKGEFFMLPEMSQTKKITLYQAKSFPYQWEPCLKFSLPSKPYRDSTLFKQGDIWWLFTTWDDSRLHLYYTADLWQGDWTPHPENPVSQGRYARPAGRIFFWQQRLFSVSQDPLPGYGSRVMLKEILTMTPENYQEVLLGPYFTPGGRGWNADRMHHADFYYPAPLSLVENKSAQNDWLIVADGYQAAFNLDSLQVRMQQFKNWRRRKRNPQ